MLLSMTLGTVHFPVTYLTILSLVQTTDTLRTTQFKDTKRLKIKKRVVTFRKTLQSFPCINESAMRRSWWENTAGRQHRRRGAVILQPIRFQCAGV
jgi:hypothetical protein